MNWTIVSVILAFFFGVFAVANYLSSNIDKQIEVKFNDPVFISRVAEQVRLPFIIFDENERVTVNSGAEEYVESVKVVRKTITGRTTEPFEIIGTIKIVCKKFLLTQPVIQCLTSGVAFHDAKRVGQRDWEFTVYHGGQALTDSPLSQGDPPPELFKLDIIPDVSPDH